MIGELAPSRGRVLGWLSRSPEAVLLPDGSKFKRLRSPRTRPDTGRGRAHEDGARRRGSLGGAADTAAQASSRRVATERATRRSATPNAARPMVRSGLAGARTGRGSRVQPSRDILQEGAGMTARMGLVLDCADPEALAGFWAAALGYTNVGSEGSYVMLVPADGEGGPQLLLQRVSES